MTSVTSKRRRVSHLDQRMWRIACRIYHENMSIDKNAVQIICSRIFKQRTLIEKVQVNVCRLQSGETTVEEQVPNNNDAQLPLIEEMKRWSEEQDAWRKLPSATTVATDLFEGDNFIKEQAIVSICKKKLMEKSQIEIVTNNIKRMQELKVAEHNKAVAAAKKGCFDNKQVSLSDLLLATKNGDEWKFCRTLYNTDLLPTKENIADEENIAEPKPKSEMKTVSNVKVSSSLSATLEQNLAREKVYRREEPEKIGILPKLVFRSMDNGFGILCRRCEVVHLRDIEKAIDKISDADVIIRCRRVVDKLLDLVKGGVYNADTSDKDVLQMAVGKVNAMILEESGLELKEPAMGMVEYKERRPKRAMPDNAGPSGQSILMEFLAAKKSKESNQITSTTVNKPPVSQRPLIMTSAAHTPCKGIVHLDDNGQLSAYPHDNVTVYNIAYKMEMKPNAEKPPVPASPKKRMLDSIEKEAEEGGSPKKRMLDSIEKEAEEGGSEKLALFSMCDALNRIDEPKQPTKKRTKRGKKNPDRDGKQSIALKVLPAQTPSIIPKQTSAVGGGRRQPVSMMAHDISVANTSTPCTTPKQTSAVGGGRQQPVSMMAHDISVANPATPSTIPKQTSAARGSRRQPMSMMAHDISVANPSTAPQVDHSAFPTAVTERILSTSKQQRKAKNKKHWDGVNARNVYPKQWSTPDKARELKSMYGMWKEREVKDHRQLVHDISYCCWFDKQKPELFCFRRLFHRKAAGSVFRHKPFNNFKVAADSPNDTPIIRVNFANTFVPDKGVKTADSFIAHMREECVPNTVPPATCEKPPWTVYQSLYLMRPKITSYTKGPKALSCFIWKYPGTEYTTGLCFIVKNPALYPWNSPQGS